MAPDADATAGTSKGWHDLEAVLAEEPDATLLVAYLAQPLWAPRRSEIQTAGRTSPRNSCSTALPREGRIRKQALSAWWNTQIQKVFLPTRTLVSSEASTVLASSRCLIRLVCAAKAGALSCSSLASALSLISSPNRSRISRASRSNGMAWPKRK